MHHPAGYFRAVKEIAAKGRSATVNLIHLPDKLAGV